jgi:hypothetical protein
VDALNLLEVVKNAELAGNIKNEKLIKDAELAVIIKKEKPDELEKGGRHKYWVVATKKI